MPISLSGPYLCDEFIDLSFRNPGSKVVHFHIPTLRALLVPKSVLALELQVDRYLLFVVVLVNTKDSEIK
jgi:hypothetical protein